MCSVQDTVYRAECIIVTSLLVEAASLQAAAQWTRRPDPWIEEICFSCAAQHRSHSLPRARMRAERTFCVRVRGTRAGLTQNAPGGWSEGCGLGGPAAWLVQLRSRCAMTPGGACPPRWSMSVNRAPTRPCPSSCAPWRSSRARARPLWRGPRLGRPRRRAASPRRPRCGRIRPG